MKLTRRSMAKGTAGAFLGSALAGCMGEPGDGPSAENSGYAAFFTLWDWSQQVGGEQFGFENPIPVGQMGHGWEPPGDIARDIAGSDVFVYLDTPEFSWAQNVAAQLEADYDDVVVIDGLAGFGPEQFIPWNADSIPTPDHEFDFDPATVEIGDFDVIDRDTGTITADYHIDHWHGGLPDIPLDGTVSLGAVFEDEHGRVLPLGDNETFQFDVRLESHAPEGIVRMESHGDHVHLSGESAGRTLVVFQLKHGEEVVWESDDAPLDAEVVDEVDAESLDEFYDPHVWVDPVLAGQVVESIADELATVDPDNAATYEENAASYNERLADVDRQFEQLVEEADRDVAVIAGHDSFQYVEHRYGFSLHSPTGISPNASPSPGDIADTIELVDREGIDTILYDPFETPDDEEIPNLAQTIIENTGATEAAPLSPAEGTLAEWSENGWGWVEQMEEINLPSLRSALGAE